MIQIKKIFISAIIAVLSLSIFCSKNGSGVKSSGGISRLISLSPSITREIIDLGYEDSIVGVTSYDDYKIRGAEIVGTLVQPNFEKILMLKPDLVVSSEEDSLVQNVDRLASAGIAVQRFKKNRNFSDICENYIQLGKLLDREIRAREKTKGYHTQLERLKKESMHSSAGTAKRGKPIETNLPQVAMFISHRPLMAVSEDSYIGKIIRDSGGICAYGRVDRPYPLVSFESLLKLDPDVVISVTGEKDDFFEKLRVFPQLKCRMKNGIYTISHETISYYTPADYLDSVRIITGILRKFAYDSSMQ
jgi:iron complex transport system substrate-binding protein